MHLHEDEDNLETWSEDVEYFSTGDELVGVEANCKQSSHLNANINDCSDTKYCKNKC